mmetsp:Transcript_28000/g.51645  ORF Transcript_28000/g.51645 Transcript_28000/m.51645 type:complete len:486 (-) Transcript_28000:66-1523(-)
MAATRHYRKLLIVIAWTLFAIIQFRSSDQSFLRNETTSNLHTTHTNIFTSDGRNNNVGSTQNNVRISFRLHEPNHVDLEKFSNNYICPSNLPYSPRAESLPPSLARRTVLNFTTSISTNLKIVFMGDSVGGQFSQAFDSASVVDTAWEESGEHNTTRWTQSYGNYGNTVCECLTVSAPILGGGVSAFWRMRDLMTMSAQGKVFCDQPHHGGDRGWDADQALTLRDHTYNSSGSSSSNSSTVGYFDAAVIRIPHGWLTIDQITKERIIETIHLVSIYLGAKTAIVTLLPINNNVKTVSDLEGIIQINRMVRDVATNWSPIDSHDVQWVLVQSFSNFTNQVIWENSQQIGFQNISIPDTSQEGWEQAGADFLLNRLNDKGKWSPSIPMICSDTSYGNKKDACLPNKISRDGTHWCMNTVGPRYVASIACLLGCIYNGKEQYYALYNDTLRSSLRSCEQECNDQFMSIVPVDEGWVGNGTVIFSAAKP